MRERGKQLQSGMREANGQRGFSLIELSVVIMLILIISAMALIAYLPTLQDAQYDAAMKEVLDQLRQAREYAITNRRYVQVTFPVQVVNGITRYQIVTTQRNDLTAGGGAANTVLSTVQIEPGNQFYVFAGSPDTPDGYGNAGPIVFEGTIGGPVGGMLFQSDGELVDGATYQPINGTVFTGFPGKKTSARAVTVLGGTGRVRGWKGTGTLWFRF